MSWAIAGLFTAIVVMAFIPLIVRRLPFSVWSPVYALPLIYVVLATTGYVYYEVISQPWDANTLGVSPGEREEALRVFLIAVDAFLSGALVYLLLSKKKMRQVRRTSHSPRGSRRAHVPTNPRWRLPSIFALSLPLGLLIAGKGFSQLLWRKEYLLDNHHYLTIVGGLLSMPAALALGYLTGSRQHLLWRSAYLLLIALYSLLFVSLSSRALPLVILLYLIGIAYGGGRRRAVLGWMAVWLFSLPMLIHIPIALRSMPNQGLVPLPRNLTEVFAGGLTDIYPPMVSRLLKNLTFGLPLTAYIKHAPPIPLKGLFVSVNPLPTFLSPPGSDGWDDIRDQLRVNRFIPYNALGELVNHGWIWLVLYYSLIGAVAGWIDVGLRLFKGRQAGWGFLAASGLFLLFAIASTQYNLRSVTRYVYYALIIAISWQLLCRVRVRPGVRPPSRSRQITAISGSVGGEGLPDR